MGIVESEDSEEGSVSPFTMTLVFLTIRRKNMGMICITLDENLFQKSRKQTEILNV